MTRLLITRPEHDDTTHYLSKWSKLIIDKAVEKGTIITDLNGKRANRKETTGILSKQNPELVILNGHGNENTVTGYKNEPLIIANNNHNLLKDKIIYAISCRSAKILGRVSVENSNAKAYIGYDDDFIFFYDPHMITNPLCDKTAELFLKPSNELMLSLIKGNTVAEACEKSKETFKENINKVLSSETSKEDTIMARYLWWNLQHQVYHGNGNESI